jgi:hypothetical protein
VAYQRHHTDIYVEISQQALVDSNPRARFGDSHIIARLVIRPCHPRTEPTSHLLMCVLIIYTWPRVMHFG